jgi:ferredoxin
MGEDIYEINPAKCTECVGHFEEPQCQVVCPVECIEIHPDWRESREQLLERYEDLTSTRKPA